MTTSNNTDTDSDTQKRHVEGSRVVHNKGCSHLERADEENIEPITEEEAEEYRTCHQCVIDEMSPAEKHRRWNESRRNTTTRVEIRR